MTDEEKQIQAVHS